MAAEKITLASGRLGKIVVIRLAPGSDLLQSITEVVYKEGITSGLILSGVGSLRRIVLRNVRSYPKAFPITDEARIFTSLEGPLELLSISGNISLREDGQTVVHAHVTVSSGCPESIAYGGHLVAGAIIYTTGELVLAETEGVELQRIFNEATKTYELAPVADNNT
jgi:predicted DNA-binding protein with PD1-like motif